MVKLQDLFVASIAFQTTLIIIFLIISFTLLNVLIFKIFPLILLITGLLLLTSSDLISTVFPLNLFFASLEHEVLVIIGFLSVALAWTSFYVGNSSSYLTKSGYGLLIALTTALLTYNQIKAKLTLDSVIFELKTNKLVAGYVITFFASIAVSIGHLVGPKIIEVLENRDKKTHPVKC